MEPTSNSGRAHGGLGSDEWRVNDANCGSGRIFATLASVKEGYGNLMLTPRNYCAAAFWMPFKRRRMCESSGATSRR
jgi:hypothetical protein